MFEASEVYRASSIADTAAEMKIASDHIALSCPESEIYNRLLSLDNKHILELGYGRAEKTRDIATSGVNRRITAMEVDEITHRENLQTRDLPNVTFGLSGAQDIPLDDETVDVVFMFKSLHHVPLELMEPSLREIQRVLKPAGLAYISEPVFAGDYNEILRIFHDEQKVREAAFNTLKKVINEGLFSLLEETFFLSPTHFENFAAFENRVIKVSHGNYVLDEKQHRQVKQLFERHSGENGTQFHSPVRVDLLQK